MLQITGHLDDQNGNQPDKPPETITQGASDVFRTLGLGSVPTILGAGYEGIRATRSALGDKSVYATDPQTGQALEQNPFMTEKQLGNYSNPVSAGIDTLKNEAGLASWAIPATNVFKGANLAAKGANLAIQGGIQGGLQSFSQDNATPESILQGAGWGAVSNPAIAGGMNMLTDKIPRYLGFRAYGKAGLKLPEVLKAEQEYGTQDLQAVKDHILESSKGTTTKENLLQPIIDLASNPSWVGTPGLSDKTAMITRQGGKRTIESGALKDIGKQLEQSTDALDFYSRVKNMAYPTADSPAANRLAGFMRSAAHNVREQIINTSDNPNLTRQAMDTYAAQMAIKAAKNEKNVNTIANKIGRYLPEGEGALSVLGLMSAIPGVHQAALPVLLDAALTNRFVGPKIASGLVNTGQILAKTRLDNVLRRLGVGAVVGKQVPQE